MFSKALIALVAASFLQDVVALSPRRHAAHIHMNGKRGYVTEVVTVTQWATVTVDGAEPSSTSSTHSLDLSTTSSPAEAAPTAELLNAARIRPTEVPAPVVPAAPVPAEPASPAVPAAPAAPVETNIAVPATGSGSSTGGGSSAPAGARGRGLAYNDASLLTRFLGSDSKISWAYNWAQTGETKAGVEFVPMMWSTGKGFPTTWEANAKKMIAAGSKALFSFNEPDHHEQANMSPQAAAAAHKQYMNPFQGQARIGTPSVTNGGDGMGLNWLKSWFDACAGECAADFVNIHIYGVPVNVFLNHLLQAHQMFNKPVWITEFGLDGSESKVNEDLTEIIHQIETNATFSFVERYSYFMAAPNFMVKGEGMSTYGKTFAYSPAV
ncbi:glycosyl hydrolase catalytic core-domain-containing protein [Podospora conica]|nr:glycosyl hydrolase catalytic core-domain-containing protein [Schizothecium conicum]